MKHITYYDAARWAARSFYRCYCKFFCRRPFALPQNPTGYRFYFCAGILILSIATTGLCQTVSTTTAPLPADAQEAVNKGIVAAKLPDYPLAIHCFEEARKLSPQSPIIFFYLGLAESKLPGRELRAICWFEAYLANNPTAQNAAAVKDEINTLDIKSHSNLANMIRSLQEMAIQVHQLNPSNNTYMDDAIWCWSNAGEYAEAKKMVDLIPNGFWKNNELSTIAIFQVKNGDIEGAKETLRLALRTVDQIPAEKDKDLALSGIAETQADAGDIAGAKKTESKVQDPNYKCADLTLIAENQAKAGDIEGAKASLASALAITDGIHDTYYKDKSMALRFIAEAQVKADDIPGAQQTADMIEDADLKSEALKTIAAGHIAVQAGITVYTADYWLGMLDDTNPDDYCPLNTDPFLDLASYLRSLLLPGDPQKAFEPFNAATVKIVRAQTIINRMMKQQPWQ
jgi:tetratricopeptide (TPR) repeat protein